MSHQTPQNSQLKKGLLGAICGSLLLGLPAAVSPASAQVGPTQQQSPTQQQQVPLQQTPQPMMQTGAALNPCPRIYYEAPFNMNMLSPEGCPANEITRMVGQGLIPGQRQPGAPMTPSAQQPGAPMMPSAQQPGAPMMPSAQQPMADGTEVLARVTPMAGMVNVELRNNTNAEITYEIPGETEQRVLAGGEATLLQDLPLPATITAIRQDGGLIEMQPIVAQPGVLEISLNEEAGLTGSQGVLRIQDDGQIMVY